MLFPDMSSYNMDTAFLGRGMVPGSKPGFFAAASGTATDIDSSIIAAIAVVRTFLAFPFILFYLLILAGYFLSPRPSSALPRSLERE
jgi:hypothetical protein